MDHKIMGKRTIVADLEQVINEINKDMPTGYYLSLGQRYGYKAIDLMRGDSHAVVKTMIAGIRAGEAYTWLNAYREGMLMASGRY